MDIKNWDKSKELFKKRSSQLDELKALKECTDLVIYALAKGNSTKILSRGPDEGIGVMLHAYLIHVTENRIREIEAEIQAL